MKIINTFGREDLAKVYIAETDDGKRVEFVESLQPPFSRDRKWVLIISSLYGCPIECEICDAGGDFKGKLSFSEIIAQIDHMVCNRYPDKIIPAKKFKIQFARVGEPAFNMNVLDVLEQLPELYTAPGLIPSVSTVAPAGQNEFFERLIEIKGGLYPGRFQLQFSIHSTVETERDRIIPTAKWPLADIAEYGECFFREGDRKITLNFVLADKYTIEPDTLKSIFSPDIFFIKLTPLNPTFRSNIAALNCHLTHEHLAGEKEPEIANRLRDAGFEVLLSIGELEENKIGSNCGQYIKTFEKYSTLGKNLEYGYRYNRSP